MLFGISWGTKFTISGHTGALNPAGKVTYLPDDSPFLSTLISVDEHMGQRREDQAAFSPVTPLGKKRKQKCYRISITFRKK